MILLRTADVFEQLYEDSFGGSAAQNSGSLKLKYIWPHYHTHNLHDVWGLLVPAAASLLTRSLSLFINNGWNNERNLGRALLTAWSCCQTVEPLLTRRETGAVVRKTAWRTTVTALIPAEVKVSIIISKQNADGTLASSL